MSESSETAADRDANRPLARGGLGAILVESRPALLRFLTGRLNNPAEAEDVLQDVWIRLEQHPPTAPIADPLAYLFRICENAARDLRRSEGRRHVREGAWVEQEGGVVGEVLTASPERQALDRAELRRVEARLAALPERTRRVFTAFRLEGQAQQAIAGDHAISVSAVQKHLQRAYRAVAGLRDDDEADGPGAGGEDR